MSSFWPLMSFTLAPLQPDTRRPLSWQPFFDAYLPSILCVYLTSYLAIRGSPVILRAGFLPVTLYSLYRSSTTVNLACTARHECGSEYYFLNQVLLLQNTFFGLFVLTWTFCQSPRRKDKDTATVLDLIASFRGLQWTFSNTYVPKEWRPTSSRALFSLYTLASLTFHLVISDLIHLHIQTFAPELYGPGKSGPLFDYTGRPTLRSSYLTFGAGVVIYGGIQVAYDAGTLIGILLLHQPPTAWPPIFDQPWRATSLSDMWAKRWHQLFRHYFVSVGGAPARLLGLPRVFAVMGVFTTSGVLHWLGGWGMGNGAEFWHMAGFFIVSGVGVTLEGVWRKLTGVRVGGPLGWVWTMSWMVFWANWLVDGWAREGLIGSTFFPEGMRPSELLGMSLD